MADTAGPGPGTAPVVDHRVTPRGVLARRGQMWLMMGVAVGIVLIILLTGHQTPPPRPTPVSTAGALVPNPENLRQYQQRLAAADTRPQLLQATPELRPALTGRAMGQDDDPRAPAAAARPQDPLKEERQRREYESLFASNVVLSPRLSTGTDRHTAAPGATAAPLKTETAATPPSIDDVADAVVRATARHTDGATTALSQAAAPTPPASPSPKPDVAAPATSGADGPLYRVLEGTLIDTVLTNRLDGSVAAPVNCLVSTPIYAADGQQILIPAGSRVLGTTKPIQSFGETRLAVAFTRLALPNGRTYPLDQFLGLNAIGEAGLRDQVNAHYRSTFGASAAVGLISGFAQAFGAGFGTRSSGPVIITGNVGDATAQATSQTMSRMLNRLPSITIREGHRVKVYLTSDLQLPAYHATPLTRDRGIQLAGRSQ